MIRIKLEVSNDKYHLLKDKFEQKGIIIADDAEYILTENGFHLEKIVCRKGESLFEISTENIIYLESQDHTIYVKTKDDEYSLRQTLQYFESNLPDQFLRINRSYIVNTSKINSITPILGMQFSVHLENNQKLKVSRNYYYHFKDKIGFWQGGTMMNSQFLNIILSIVFILLIALALCILIYIMYKRKINRILKGKSPKRSGMPLEFRFFIVTITTLIALISSVIIIHAIDNHQYRSFYIPLRSDIREMNFDNLYDNIKLNSESNDTIYVSLDTEMVIITDKDGMIKDISLVVVISRDSKLIFYSSTYEAEKERIRFDSYRQIITQEGFTNKADFINYITLINYIDISTINSYFEASVADGEKDLSFNLFFDFISNNLNINEKGIDADGNIYDIEQSYQGILLNFYIGVLTYLDSGTGNKPIAGYVIIPSQWWVVSRLIQINDLHDILW